MNTRLLSFHCRINHVKLPPKSQYGLFEMVEINRLKGSLGRTGNFVAIQTAIIADNNQFMCKIPVGARGSSDQTTLRPAVLTQSDDVPLLSEVEMIEPVHIFLNQFMKLHSA
ncbi:hypothetical protein H5410_049640, partial [Solanum commersonii]